VQIIVGVLYQELKDSFVLSLNQDKVTLPSIVWNFVYFYLLKAPFNTIYLKLQIMIESQIMCRMDLFLSFVNLSIKEFF
jgi:hypothetical protein